MALAFNGTAGQLGQIPCLAGAGNSSGPGRLSQQVGITPAPTAFPPRSVWCSFGALRSRPIHHPGVSLSCQLTWRLSTRGWGRAGVPPSAFGHAALGPGSWSGALICGFQAPHCKLPPHRLDPLMGLAAGRTQSRALRRLQPSRHAGGTLVEPGWGHQDGTDWRGRQKAGIEGRERSPSRWTVPGTFREAEQPGWWALARFGQGLITAPPGPPGYHSEAGSPYYSWPNQRQSACPHQDRSCTSLPRRQGEHASSVHQQEI